MTITENEAKLFNYVRQHGKAMDGGHILIIDPMAISLVGGTVFVTGPPPMRIASVDLYADSSRQYVVDGDEDLMLRAICLCCRLTFTTCQVDCDNQLSYLCG